MSISEMRNGHGFVSPDRKKLRKVPKEDFLKAANKVGSKDVQERKVEFQPREEAEAQVLTGTFEALDPLAEKVFDDGVAGLLRDTNGSLHLVTENDRQDDSL